MLEKLFYSYFTFFLMYTCIFMSFLQQSSIEVDPIDVNPKEVYPREANLKGKGAVEVSSCTFWIG